MAAERLKEAHVDAANMIEIAPRDRVQAGPFDLEFIRVNHSILDGVGVAINTPLGAIVHTGDFKIDQANSDDRIDLYKFAEYGEKGVLLLLSDSTNADVAGCTDSETVVGRTLSRIFQEAEGRVILACFASSLARIKQVAKAARAAGRKLVFEGRGMIHSVKLAKSLGYLAMDDDEVTLAESAGVPDDQLVIVATGSQGEPMSALTRMAYGDHKQVVIKKGDTVILSARFIPGHEKAITRLIDLFYRQGARVLDARAVKVHTSGHGQAEELKLMLNLTRPEYFVPIHGETHKLIRHGDLARDLGWDPEQIWILENGRTLTIDDEGARFGEVVQSGRKVVDGNRLGEPEDPIFRNRLKLAGGGLVVVTVVLSRSGELLARPTVAISGVHYESDFDLTLEAAEVAERAVGDWFKAGLDGFGPDGTADTEALSAILQKEVRSLFRHSISRRPSIWPQVIVADKQKPADAESEDRFELT
jgi:ribonuclease J